MQIAGGFFLPYFVKFDLKTKERKINISTLTVNWAAGSALGIYDILGRPMVSVFAYHMFGVVNRVKIGVAMGRKADQYGICSFLCIKTSCLCGLDCHLLTSEAPSKNRENLD